MNKPMFACPCVQVLDLSENPLGINGAKVICDLLDPTITPYQFLVELRLDKASSGWPCMRLHAARLLA